MAIGGGGWGAGAARPLKKKTLELFRFEPEHVHVNFQKVPKLQAFAVHSQGSWAGVSGEGVVGEGDGCYDQISI